MAQAEVSGNLREHMTSTSTLHALLELAGIHADRSCIWGLTQESFEAFLDSRHRACTDDGVSREHGAHPAPSSQHCSWVGRREAGVSCVPRR